LTSRLTLFFLTALALVLAGFSVALYLLASSYLERQAQERLASALDTLAVAGGVEDGGLGGGAVKRPLALGREARAAQGGWEVRNGEGRVLGRSVNLGSGDLTAGGGAWLLLQRRLDYPGAVRPEPHLHAQLVLTAGLSPEPARAALRTLTAALAGLS